jgi:hypothetical protein
MLTSVFQTPKLVVIGLLLISSYQTVLAQAKANQKLTSIVKSLQPDFKYAFIESDSILQVGLKNTGKAQHNLALKICKALNSNAQSKISVVYLEDGDTGLGKCNCKTLNTGYNKVADRKLGYYYFAE